MQRKREYRERLPATLQGLPRAGEFAVGSVQSRAAARALLEAKLGSAKRLDFVVSVVGDPTKFDPPTVGKWSESADGVMVRFSRVPWGMSIEQAERNSR